MELEKVLEGIGIPVKYYEYAGVKPEYIVYNEEVEQLADYGDNDPECHITWWQVHIFTPKTGKFRDYKNCMKQKQRQFMCYCRASKKERNNYGEKRP